MHSSGKLILAATPIGSHRDASPALRELLAEADVIAAEDTRQFAALLRRLQITARGRVISYFEGNEAERTADLVEAARRGETVALVTDAGMPSVSDPGFRVVNAFIDAELPVTAVPGPSAVPTALAVSGLPSDRFCFEGFLPRKSGERRRRLGELVAEPRTMVFFEAPHRLAEFLADAADILGAERRAVICRELTKPHEEIVRDSLEGLQRWAESGVRGEVTLVVEGVTRVTTIEEALTLVRERIADGEKLSTAVGEVAAATGVNRKALYEAALAARKAEA